jgi:3-dehydro-L-gulonate 2-dehydrogenase
MAPWGAKTKKVGNNPLVIAVPRASGNHVVLDMAMSQYSMGKLAIFQAAGTPSPTPAGFDAHGNITSDPAAVINGGSGMPIGLWKGTGLALMLDLVASILSAGLSTADLAHEKWEHKVSQLFLAIDTRQLHAPEIADRIIAAYQHGNESTLYPGERVLRFRHESERSGVPIDAAVWNEITAL